MQKLLIPENEAEALALQGVLAEHGIKARIRSYHDTAYDGIFQNQKGWGVLLVEAGDLSLAREIVAEWRAAAPRELPWQDE
jgi:hypothetical protein